MAELTWVAKTDNGKVFHHAESKAKKPVRYEVFQFVEEDGGKFGVFCNFDVSQPIERERYNTVIEAKQACQRHEDALAEGGDQCGK